MTLHSALRPKDRRWYLEYMETDRLGTIKAVDEHGQIWTSTRHRRYQSQGWDCGHLHEPYQSTYHDRYGNPVTRQQIHTSHARFWQRVTKKRGFAGPVMLCEMTATLNPYDHRYTSTPLDLVERSA